MSRKFFISDLHFGHNNILKYENRPFKNVEEMDKALIRNWNAVVGKNDEVYVLGDVRYFERLSASRCKSQRSVSKDPRGHRA